MEKLATNLCALNPTFITKQNYELSFFGLTDIGWSTHQEKHSLFLTTNYLCSPKRKRRAQSNAHYFLIYQHSFVEHTTRTSPSAHNACTKHDAQLN